MAKLNSPNDVIYTPGQPALQARGQALDRMQAHEDWHRCNPGEWNCPPALNNPGDYEAIENGDNLLGAAVFEPGDAFNFGKGK